MATSGEVNFKIWCDRSLCVIYTPYFLQKHHDTRQSLSFTVARVFQFEVLKISLECYLFFLLS